MDKDTYLAFHAALVEAEKAPVHDFEDVKYFEACLPVESWRRAGRARWRSGR
jgi:methylenetetrahydrofolate--tRNA-(uracil-5-)-methyltransferase